MAEGYDPYRFIDRVFNGFKCCICQCVLNEPRFCETEEHKFCFNCISQYLPISQTCPECRQHLTLETLKNPGKNFLNILSELRIKCDYINRGCPESVELGNLQIHVNNCEYRPITCEDCHLEVNAKDVDNHKKSFCQLGGANIPGLKDIKLRQEEMKDDFLIIRARQKEHDDKQKELEETQNAYGQQLDDIDGNLYEMEGIQKRQKRKLNEVLSSLEEIRSHTTLIPDEIANEVTQLKRRRANMQKQVKKMKKKWVESETSQNHQFLESLQMSTKQARFRISENKLKIQILEMARKQDHMNVEQDEIKLKMKQLCERVDELWHRLSQENGAERNHAQATNFAISANKQDVQPSTQSSIHTSSSFL